MYFEKPINLNKEKVYAFWKCIEDSYSIEKMYEECANVLVTLVVSKNKRYQFVYFKAIEGQGIYLMDKYGEYYANLWFSKRQYIGGNAEGVMGNRYFKECLRKFKSALRDGKTEIVVERSPFPPNKNFLISQTEISVLQLLKQGLSFKEISSVLSLKIKELNKIYHSLDAKGLVSGLKINDVLDRAI